MENINEYELVDFLVYNKYIKMNLPDIEINVAEYAIINSEFIFCLHRCVNLLRFQTYNKVKQR